MLLTISTTHEPATDLGYLLHKHPDRLQSVDLTIGQAHVFYPESSDERTTAALLLDVDAIDLVRGGRHLAGKGFSLGQYVNDRPFVASSFMSVAIAKAFSTALNGKCKNKPELVDTALPLAVTVAVVSAPKGGEALIRRFFEPLGYAVNVERHQLDEQFPDWGDSRYYTVGLTNTVKLRDLLAHLYVLLPALDFDKHYFVSQNEIDKLLARGKGWIEDHPEKETITNRYLVNLRALTRRALNQLDDANPEMPEDDAPPAVIERKETLHQRRLKRVFAEIEASGAETVIDLGCGEGKLIRMLLKSRQFRKITGTDVSYAELTKCKERLYWDELAPRQKARLDLFQGSLTYRDKRLAGFDAAAVVEVIEHLDEDRLAAFERVVFEFARPKHIFLTTPNGEYNVLFDGLTAGTMRHADHRFEWTRAEFQNWGDRVAAAHGYSVRYAPLGDEDPAVGAPSQMAIFTHEN